VGALACPDCGQTLGPAAARQERKTVTVLFCDLVGFTQLAEEMDPEDVASLLRPYHERVRGGARAIRRHGREVHRRRGIASLRLPKGTVGV
jgi:class 3 adenylate cyclase